MTAKFYKKSEPRNKPVLGNGSQCEFTTLDGATGYFSTDNDYVQGELARLMQAGRYGMSEIAWEEFDRDYVQKKTTAQSSKPRWREELSASNIHTLRQAGASGSAAPSAAAVGDTLAPRVTVEDAPAGPAPSAPKPRVGKRASKPNQ